jgi:hypothetical protein
MNRGGPQVRDPSLGSDAEGDAMMKIESHLATLERRHGALEQALAEALAHPSVDDLAIAEMKRRKLLLKDEMERLRSETVHH